MILPSGFCDTHMTYSEAVRDHGGGWTVRAAGGGPNAGPLCPLVQLRATLVLGLLASATCPEAGELYRKPLAATAAPGLSALLASGVCRTRLRPLPRTRACHPCRLRGGKRQCAAGRRALTWATRQRLRSACCCPDTSCRADSEHIGRTLRVPGAPPSAAAAAATAATAGLCQTQPPALSHRTVRCLLCGAAPSTA